MGNGTRESKFWGRIVNGLWRGNRVLNRIENGVLDGMPDSYYCIEGTGGWIELKCPQEPKRGTTPLFSGNHPLSLAQRNWLLSHHQAGGISWVAIETESTMLLIEGRFSDFINTLTLEQMKQFANFWCSRPVSENDWQEFTEWLVQSTRHRLYKQRCLRMTEGG